MIRCCGQNSLSGGTCIPVSRADSPIPSVLNYLFDHACGANSTIHIVFSLGQMPAIPTAYYHIHWPELRSSELLFLKQDSVNAAATWPFENCSSWN